MRKRLLAGLILGGFALTLAATLTPGPATARPAPDEPRESNFIQVGDLYIRKDQIVFMEVVNSEWLDFHLAGLTRSHRIHVSQSAPLMRALNLPPIEEPKAP